MGDRPLPGNTVGRRPGWRRAFWLLGLALLLAGPALACRLVSEGLSLPATPTSFPTATAPPAATTAPAATQIAFQDYKNEALGLSFRYPAGWLLDEAEDIPLVASDADALGDDPLAAGAFVLFLVEDASQLGDGPLVEVLRDLIGGLYENGEVTSGPEATTVQGQEAATATIDVPQADGSRVLAILTVVRQRDRAAFMSAEIAQGDAALYRDVVDAILGSVALHEPAEPLLEGELAYGDTVSGEVTGTRGSAWRFAGTAGDVIDVEVTPADEALDVTLDVRRGDGRSILPGGVVDEAFGTEVVEGLELPEDGDYVVVLRGFAGSTGAYSLTVVQSDGEPATPEPVIQESIGLVVSDVLGPDELTGHAFPFYAPAGAGINAQVVPAEGLDVVVEMWNDDDGSLLEIIDLSFDIEQVRFSAPAEGNYSLVVRGFEGQTGEYTITLGGSGSVIFELAVGDEVTGLFDEQANIAFMLGLNPNETVVITSAPDAETDLVLELSDLDGNVLAGADDYFAGGAETLTYSAPPEIEAGTLYFIRVRDFGGRTGGSFTLTIAGQGTG